MTLRFSYIALLLSITSAGAAFAQVPQTDDVGPWLATTPGHAEVLVLPSRPSVKATEAPRLASNWQTLSDQLVRLLSVSDADVQERALQHLLYFATRHGDQLVLTGATEPVLMIYQQAEEERHRLLAAAVLYTIDSEQAQAALAQETEAEVVDRAEQVAALHDRYHR